MQPKSFLGEPIEKVYDQNDRGNGGSLFYSSSIFVPSTYGDRYIPPDVHRNIAYEVARRMTGIFGVSTIIPGFVMSKTGAKSEMHPEHFMEPSYIVSSPYHAADEDTLVRYYKMINAIAYGLGRSLKQNSIMVTHSGKNGHSTHFIETHDGIEHKPNKGQFHFAIGKDDSLRRLAEVVHDSIKKHIGD